MHIRPVDPSTELHALLALREALWPHALAADEEPEVREWLARPGTVALVAVEGGGRLIGFAEAQERSYADGCDTAPVAYLEGWYVQPDARGRGVGRALVDRVEAWARARGYAELASDAEL